MVVGSTKGVDGCMFRVRMKGIKVIAHLGTPISKVLCIGVVTGSHSSHLLWVKNDERNATLVMVVVMVPCFRCASINKVT